MDEKHMFEARCLYDQQTIIEEGAQVHSKVFAISYMYPGALTRTTARCRLTAVYRPGSLDIEIMGGTIEQWSDKGWMNIEEFFDTSADFGTVDEFFKCTLGMYKAFILGIPVSFAAKRDPMPAPKPPNPKKDPKLRVLSFKDAFNKPNDYKKIDKKTTELKEENDQKSKDTDDPDFDWI